VIETAYQDVAANYTNGGNLERALMRLGEINMERHKYATACAYFQRFLAAADGNDPRIADIKSIVERYRSATDE
jgi:cytochrome c-type biogenesis protein CcmH/NrfG